jgi:quercetin dioxygenase-like cupin family protein
MMSEVTVDRKRIEDDWRVRGFSCGLWEDPPGQEWLDFVHDTDELVLVLEGDLELEMTGHRQQCSVGKEILIPAKEVHSVRNIGSTVSRWLYGYRVR